MKNLLLFILFSLILSFVGCGKEDNDVETPAPDGEDVIVGKDFTLSDTAIVITDSIELAEIILKANGDWQITGGREWCSVSPASGSAGTFTIQIKLDKNQTYEERITEFVIEGKTEKLKLRVRQRAMLSLQTSAATYNISDSGGELEVELYRSINYDVIIPKEFQSWITQVVTKSWGTDKLKFFIAKHTGQNERIGKVIFKDKESDYADTIQIIQEFVDSNIEIPDVYFKNYCLTLCDKNADGMISRKEAKKVSYNMFIPQKVTSLEGIEHFTELLILYFSNCKIESADLSRNTKLYTLDCENVGLKELKLSDNGVLSILNCDGNKLTNLSSDAIRNLSMLSCSNNQLTSLTLGSKLTSLDCDNNKLTKLDLTPCSDLSTVHCDNNKLVSLGLNRKLGTLYCSHNNLKLIEFPALSTLSHLWCDNNQFTSLDVSPCLMLESLSCGDNPLKSIRVDGLLALYNLSCANTNLMEIDISTNINLTSLFLYQASSLKTVWVWKDFTAPSGFWIPETAAYKEKE